MMKAVVAVIAAAVIVQLSTAQESGYGLGSGSMRDLMRANMQHITTAGTTLPTAVNPVELETEPTNLPTAVSPVEQVIDPSNLPTAASPVESGSMRDLMKANMQHLTTAATTPPSAVNPVELETEPTNLPTAVGPVEQAIDLSNLPTAASPVESGSMSDLMKANMQHLTTAATTPPSVVVSEEPATEPTSLPTFVSPEEPVVDPTNIPEVELSLQITNVTDSINVTTTAFLMEPEPEITTQVNPIPTDAPEQPTSTSILQNFDHGIDVVGQSFTSGLELVTAKNTPAPGKPSDESLLPPPARVLPALDWVDNQTADYWLGENNTVPTEGPVETIDLQLYLPDAPNYTDNTTQHVDVKQSQISNGRDGYGVENDLDEFGEPRLVERMSRGQKYLVPNPKFQGNETNSVGEQTHTVFVNDGVRSLYPDRFYRVDITTTTTTASLELTTEMPNTGGDKSQASKSNTGKMENDVDEFGQPRLIERKSRGQMYMVPNPQFQGSEMNSRGEKTHTVYDKNGVRRVYPDQSYRMDTAVMEKSPGKEEVPQKDGFLIFEDEGFNMTSNGTDPSTNQTIHTLPTEKEQKNVVPGNQREASGVLNDKDEFGEPRLVQRMSRRLKIWAPNAYFQGSPVNADGEVTHIEYIKGGVRRLYPNRHYRKYV